MSHPPSCGNLGWSEPAATSAPIQAVQAVLGMNQKHILFPCPGMFLFCLKIFPSYLHPTFPLLPPSPHFLLTPSPKLEKAPKLE